MTLDKQEILSELGSVMNKLQSADCGCMGNIFSQGNQHSGRNGVCGKGGHHTYGHAPCAGEPCPMSYGGCPSRCAGYNAPKIMSDTYGYLKENVMQPVIKEVYNDLKSLSPANTVANNPLASQMGLMQNTPTNMGDNVGRNIVNQMGMAAPTPNMRQGQNTPANIGDIVGRNTVHQMGMAAPTPNMGHGQNTSANMSDNVGRSIVHQMGMAAPTQNMGHGNSPAPSYANNNFITNPQENHKTGNPNTGNFGMHHNHAKPSHINTPFSEMFGDLTNGGLGFDPMAIAKQMNPANEKKAAMNSMNKALLGSVNPANTVHNKLQRHLSTGQLQPENSQQRLMQPTMQQSQLYPVGVQQGLLQPQTLQSLPFNQEQIQPLQAVAIPQEQMQPMGQMYQGLLQPQGQMPHQAQTPGQMHQQSHMLQGQVPQQDQMPHQGQMQGQLQHQGQVQQQGHMIQQGQVLQQGQAPQQGQVLQQGQMYQQAPQQGQMIQGQMAQQGQVQQGRSDGYNLPQGQPIEKLMPVQAQPVQQGQLYQPKQRNEEKYNTLGQPVQQLPARLYSSYIPPGPQTLAAQPAFYPPNFNLKGVVSKTSISGGTAVGKLNHFYNMNNGSNAREHMPERPVNDVDKIIPSNIVDNSAALVNVQDPKMMSIVTPEGIQEQRDTAGAAGDILPIASGVKRSRNGLQDLDFISKPISAAWSFHGEKRYTPLRVRPRA